MCCGGGWICPKKNASNPSKGPRIETVPSDEWLLRKFRERPVPSGKEEMGVRVCPTFLGVSEKGNLL
jgi:hypothetical protein